MQKNGRRNTAAGQKTGLRGGGVGGSVRFAGEGDKGGGQPEGRRTKETSEQAERMQREHGNSSTAMGSAPVRCGGQAGGRVL